jgi:hypothetical protein
VAAEATIERFILILLGSEKKPQPGMAGAQSSRKDVDQEIYDAILLCRSAPRKAFLRSAACERPGALYALTIGTDSQCPQAPTQLGWPAEFINRSNNARKPLAVIVPTND